MKIKKIVKYILIVIIVISLIIGIVIYFTQKNKKEIPVYSIEELSMDNYLGESLTSQGTIKEDKMQAVYLNSTQQIEKIMVKEGQKVKKGDVLLKYNTTLTNIELEGKQININKLELDLGKAQKELSEIQNYKPDVPIYGSLPAEQPVEEPVIKHTELPKLTPPLPEIEASKEINPAPLTGSGTASSPYMFIWKENKEYDKAFIESLLNRVSPTCKEVVAIFMIRENDTMTGNLLKCSKIKFTKTDDIIPDYNFSILDTSSDVDPLYPNSTQEEQQPEQPNVVEPEVGPIYSAIEIKKMIADKEKEINDINLNIKIAKKEYDKLKTELQNTTVTSKFDGVVKKVLSKDDENINSKPIIVVSGGGGYYLEGRIDEYNLSNIKIGQKVNIQSYESGINAEGTIEKISNYPVQNDFYGFGNSNVSYYPYTVKVSENEELKADEYVEISVIKEGENEISDTFYLPAMFILTENGKNYAYIANSDDKLEKRTVITGKNMNGSIEIYNGIERNERIAFPYGKAVKEGAKVVEASVNDLYDEM